MNQIQYSVNSKQSDKLQKSNYLYAYLIFIVYQLCHDKLKWQNRKHIDQERAFKVSRSYLFQISDLSSILFIEERGEKIKSNVTQEYEINASI